jgi:hypothetical protein
VPRVGLQQVPEAAPHSHLFLSVSASPAGVGRVRAVGRGGGRIQGRGSSDLRRPPRLGVALATCGPRGDFCPLLLWTLVLGCPVAVCGVSARAARADPAGRLGLCALAVFLPFFHFLFSLLEEDEENSS